MRPFSIYMSCKEFLDFHREKLVSIISKIVKQDIMYLLGESLYRRRSESIFCPEAPTSQHAGDYFLLIVVQDLGDKESYQWQDEIEQQCSSVVTVTTIVLKTSAFQQWVKEGHPFAAAVRNAAPPIFENSNIIFDELETGKNDWAAASAYQFYKQGLNMSKEFLARAELFKMRKQYSIAAFMLHQSAEQSLRTILKIGTGYHCSTHNLGRLIKYASMVSYQLPDVFPRDSDKDKHYFKLLQKAYSDTRYTEDYNINIQELLCLMGKVNTLIELLDNMEKSSINAVA